MGMLQLLKLVKLYNNIMVIVENIRGRNVQNNNGNENNNDYKNNKFFLFTSFKPDL